MAKYLDETGLATLVKNIKDSMLSKSGGTITGDLTVEGTTTVQTPANDTDAANKKYVDDAVAAVGTEMGDYLPITGGTVTGDLTVAGATNVAEPTEDSNAATKKYVDDAIAGIETESGSDYELPIASAETLGGIKVGDNLSISDDGTLSATASGSVEGDYLPLSGGTMTGTINLSSQSSRRGLEGERSISGGGILINNTSPTEAILINNESSGYGIEITNTGEGRGLYVVADEGTAAEITGPINVNLPVTQPGDEGRTFSVIRTDESDTGAAPNIAGNGAVYIHTDDGLALNVNAGADKTDKENTSSLHWGANIVSLPGSIENISSFNMGALVVRSATGWIGDLHVADVGTFIRHEQNEGETLTNESNYGAALNVYQEIEGGVALYVTGDCEINGNITLTGTVTQGQSSLSLLSNESAESLDKEYASLIEAKKKDLIEAAVVWQDEELEAQRREELSDLLAEYDQKRQEVNSLSYESMSADEKIATIKRVYESEANALVKEAIEEGKDKLNGLMENLTAISDSYKAAVAEIQSEESEETSDEE